MDFPRFIEQIAEKRYNQYHAETYIIHKTDN